MSLDRLGPLRKPPDSEVKSGEGEPAENLEGIVELGKRITDDNFVRNVETPPPNSDAEKPQGNGLPKWLSNLITWAKGLFHGSSAKPSAATQPSVMLTAPSTTEAMAQPSTNNTSEYQSTIQPLMKERSNAIAKQRKVVSEIEGELKSPRKSEEKLAADVVALFPDKNKFRDKFNEFKSLDIMTAPAPDRQNYIRGFNAFRNKCSKLDNTKLGLQGTSTKEELLSKLNDWYNIITGNYEQPKKRQLEDAKKELNQLMEGNPYRDLMEKL
jgi:hypothetical protein